MRRARAHRRRERWVLAELETRIWPGRRATLFGYLWWWRYELGIAAGLPAALILLIRALGAGPTAAGTLATIGLCCFCPPARHAVVTAAWRITTPHRLRAGFVQARIHSRNGRLPTILRTSRQPFGEQVRLWCPAGSRQPTYAQPGTCSPPAAGPLMSRCPGTRVTLIWSRST